MYTPHNWVGNMETYPDGPQILQGQNLYQVTGKPSVVPQMQQAVQSNASLPNIVQSGYQYTPTSNVVASSGVNRSAETANTKTMNQANYVVQEGGNSNKVVLWIQNPGYRSNNLNLNHVPENVQRDQVQNIQATGQRMSSESSANVATITTQETFRNLNIANHPARGLMKIPEPTHVDLNTHVNEKVGSLKIHISESFLPWNITNKTVLDLEFMRHLFNISGVDVILTDAKQNEKGIRAAVEQLLHSRVLPDWLVLKCEEKEIPFLKVNNQVEIYAASNFTALLNVVTQETCLPLPFITQEQNYLKYLYLNFPKTGNDKVKKLNMPIFHVGDNGKKRLLCKYPGIRLDCDFQNRVESFIIHVHQSALLIYETSVAKIRQYIIYRHVIWGFLQMWIRRVMEKYNQCFKFDDIAKNISLCKFEDGKSCGNDNELIYDIGYLNCYLKFDPVTLKETKATFSLDNFSTNTVCNLAIVQFYKQFFLINDMHYSDALRNSVLFFEHYYGKSDLRASSCMGVPQGLKSLRSIPRTNESPPEQVVPLLNNAYKNVVNGNSSASTSGSAVSQGITIGSINKNVFQVAPDKTSAIPVSEKPRLKTRTVEEINSSVDLVNRTDVNNSAVASDRLKTRTVQQINSSVGFVKRTEMNNRPVAPTVGQTPNAKRSDNTRRLNYGSFVSLIQKFLENCYATNRTEISATDESNEEVVIRRRFDEAVRRAIRMETIELFIEKIYVHLQLYYTNSTSQNILNKMIWRAIEAKYPHLKEHVSKNIAMSLRDKLSDGDPRNSNKSSSVLESGGQLNETVIGNNQNGNQNSIPTLAVTQQLDVTNSNSEKVVCSSGENNEAVSAISKDQDVDLGKEATKRGRKASSPCVDAEKITEQETPIPPATEEPKDRNAGSSESLEECLPSSGSERLLKKTKKHSKPKRSKESGIECPPYRNTLTFVRVSTSPATFRISSKSGVNSKTQSTQFEENESCSTPEENSIQASNETSETDQASEENSIQASNETSETDQTSEENSIQASNETSDTDQTSEENSMQASNETSETDQASEENSIQASNETSETDQASEENSMQASNETSDTDQASEENSMQASNETSETDQASEENSIQASNETSETDRASEDPEQQAQSVEETEEVDEECPRQEDYSKYNLKPCSVVLNSNEVKMYMKKYRKKKRREISSEESDVEQDEDYVPRRGRRRFCRGDSDVEQDEDYVPRRGRRRFCRGDSDVEQDEDYVPRRGRRRFCRGDSDDSDFITERKRIRRAVSDIQYMEARTRVLQRLRKRKSLYVGYERTRISGEELDSFLVRQGSLSKLNHQENSGEDSEGEYEIGEGNDSEAEESQRRKTRTKKWPAMKEVRVALVRLEDTPEYEKHRERLLGKEKCNPSVNYLNLKKLPHVKRKYFEIREGKFYLKEGYCVKDGKIVRADEEDGPMRPKREPESPARETDFDHHQIKRESALD